MTDDANGWRGRESYYNFNYSNNTNRTETSIPTPQVKMSNSGSNPDPMNALIGVITNNINTSFIELKQGIKNVKDENEKSNDEIKEKLNNLNNSSWAHKLLEPSLMAIFAVFIIINSCFLLVALKHFTGTSIGDVRDYILFFGGGLVGILGGDKMKGKIEKSE